MNNRSQLSIIIPTYNRPNLIGRAIKSVLAQTYQNFEIVIVDSSPDNDTEKAVHSFNEKRIKYIHNKKRTNTAASRNQGVRESSQNSKYIAFLDDDDEFLPQFLEKTVEVLEEKEDIAMATSNLELRTRDGKRIRESHGSANIWEQGISCGCVIRKEIFTKENFWYNERLEVMEDPDLGVRVLINHKWECLPEMLWAYYVYPSSNEKTLCATPSIASVKAAELFYEKNYQIFKQMGNKALGFLYLRTGKVFLRAGAGKKGRSNLLKAFLIYPHPVYLLYYLLSLLDLFFPNLFRSIHLRTWKQKIFRGKL